MFVFIAIWIPVDQGQMVVQRQRFVRPVGKNESGRSDQEGLAGKDAEKNHRSIRFVSPSTQDISISTTSLSLRKTRLALPLPYRGSIGVGILNYNPPAQDEPGTPFLAHITKPP